MTGAGRVSLLVATALGVLALVSIGVAAAYGGPGAGVGVTALLAVVTAVGTVLLEPAREEMRRLARGGVRISEASTWQGRLGKADLARPLSAP